MWLVLVALRRPFLVWVGMLLVVVLGTVAYRRTPTDILPNLKVPVVVVFVSYRGMPAPDMEQSVIKPLEQALARCDHLEHIESRSLLGIGIIRVYFRPVVDPDAAASQVLGLVNGEMQNLPPGMLPPSVLKYDASAVPVGNLVISSATRDDKFLLDLADHELREELAGIEGLASAPVFGGVFRQIQIYVRPHDLEAHKLSLMDVSRLVNAQSQVIPTGEMRIDTHTFYVTSNSMVGSPRDFAKLPLWTDGRKVVTLGDVADVIDGQRWRTNIVRADGKRAVYMPLLRQAGSSAVHVVDNVREFLETIPEHGVIPDDVEVQVVFDQSQYVREGIANLRYEAFAGAGLASLVVLLFLGSLRGTWIVALAIPLSVLAALLGLYFAGHTLNIMTLGGLALVLGRVVDDCIVDVENTTRHLQMGKPPGRAVLDSAREISVPVLLATVTTCVVFGPVAFMAGVGKYLFTPLAVAAVLAMFASYVVSRTVSPVCCALYLRPHTHAELPPRWLFGLGGFLALALVVWLLPGRFAPMPAGARRAAAFVGGAGAALLLVGLMALLAPRFGRGFDRLAAGYGWLLRGVLGHRRVVLGLVLALLVPTVWMGTQLGQELFPEVDASEFTIHLRAPGGPRVEETEKLVARIEQIIREEVPEEDRRLILANVGISSRWSAVYTVNNGPHAAFVRVQLRSGFQGRRLSTHAYVERLRGRLADGFPGCAFFFETGGMIRQILNAGAPAPVEVQVIGRDPEARREAALRLAGEIAQLPQVQDSYLPQGLEIPQLQINVDRTLALQMGMSETDVIRNVIAALMSTAQLAPNFWIDPVSGNPYIVGVQYPEYEVRDKNTLLDIPIGGDRGGPRAGSSLGPRTLRSVATIADGQAPIEIYHQNTQRVSQIFVNVTGNDLAGTASAVERLARGMHLPKAVRVEVRGEVGSMRASFREMAFNLALAVLLVYLLLAAQFSSWIDPLIMIVAAPLGLIGVAGLLWVTGTSLNIQSCMGVLMMVGISVSNSVLLVQFANDERQAGRPTREAIRNAAATRLRPILMTTVATVLGLMPLAVHLQPGDEMNLPLARAVIGGLIGSTLLTLLLVPVMYTFLKPVGAGGPAAAIDIGERGADAP